MGLGRFELPLLDPKSRVLPNYTITPLKLPTELASVFLGRKPNVLAATLREHLIAQSVIETESFPCKGNMLPLHHKAFLIISRNNL